MSVQPPKARRRLVCSTPCTSTLCLVHTQDFLDFSTLPAGSMLRSTILLLGVALLCACDSTESEDSGTAIPSTVAVSESSAEGSAVDGTNSRQHASSEGEQSEASAEAPSFTIEEWGLLRIRGDETELATSGFLSGARRETLDGPILPPMAKPVIYVIYVIPDDPDHEPFELIVELGYGAGLRHELWPPPTSDSPTSVTWEIRAEGRCSGEADAEAIVEHCRAFMAPAICEAEELRDYVTDEHTCLNVGERHSPVLLYNGGVPAGLAGPVSSTETGFVVGERPIAHLWWFDGGVLLHAEDLEPLQAVVTGDAPLSGEGLVSGAAVASLIQAELEEMGLTTAEEFIRAWRPDVLSSDLTWRAFGIYGPEVVEDAVPLDVSPAAQRTTRVIAFVVEPSHDELGAQNDSGNPDASERVRQQIEDEARRAAIGALLGNSDAHESTFGTPSDTSVLAIIGTTTTDEGGLGVGGLGLEGTGVAGGGVDDPGGRLGGADAVPASTGTISMGTPTVAGSMDSTVIRRVVRRHERELRDCYDRYLPQNPTMAGRVEVSFMIDSAGAVSNATVASSTLGMPGAESCMTTRLRRWRFPEPDDGGVVNVSFPFDFAPGG